MYRYDTAIDGAQLLDERCDGWYNRVDVTKLYLLSAYDCVLGQVFAAENGLAMTPWDYGMKVLGLEGQGHKAFSDPMLTANWLEEIKKRQYETMEEL